MLGSTRHARCAGNQPATAARCSDERTTRSTREKLATDDTVISLELGVTLATGTPFLGLSEFPLLTRPAGVTFIQAENSTERVRRDLDHILIARHLGFMDPVLSLYADEDGEYEQIGEKFLMEEPISKEELKQGIRRATIANKLVPVAGGSAFKNKGVQYLIDAVVDYLPSPLDIDAAIVMDPAHVNIYADGHLVEGTAS